MTRFYQNKQQLGRPVFMVHSVLQDGRTFYGSDGSGLACYLARQGYDVFVADLRGRGKSWPKTGPFSTFGLHQIITEDIPALVKGIVKRRGVIPQLWMAHGWGGVLLCSAYARFGEQLCSVEAMVHFGSRRQSRILNVKKRFIIDVLWQRLAGLLIWVSGYMPARRLRFGSSDESAQYFSDYMFWSGQTQWCDPEDGFDYARAVRQRQLPPSYYFAASGDDVFGHPNDVREFIKALGPHDSRLMILSQAGGNRQNYGHLAMLKHKDCEQDHFPVLLEWLKCRQPVLE